MQNYLTFFLILQKNLSCLVFLEHLLLGLFGVETLI